MQLLQKCSGFVFLALIVTGQAKALTLVEALALVEQQPLWQETLAGIEQSQGERLTAGQRINPSLELVSETHDKRSVVFYQPVETTDVRAYRQASADKAVLAARHQASWLRRQLMTRVERLYYQIVQKQQELVLADEEVSLLKQLRHAVRLRVKVGESPRYEQVKAEAEWLTSQTRQAVAKQQYVLARQVLAEQLALPALPEVEPVLPQESHLCALAKTEALPVESHPLSGAAQAMLAQNQDNLRYEQAQTTPQPTLILGAEQDMGIDRVKVGVSLPLPLWHQRDGQVASAKAKVNQSQARIMTVERQLQQDWKQAVLNYQIANSQVNSFESGLLKEAQEAFQIAQAAYQHGERSILDYIDAQRTLATVRKSYVASQFERHYACMDILQLSASSEDQQ